MDRDTMIWLAGAGLTGLWTGLSGAALLPLGLFILTMACSLHQPTRAIVEGWLLDLFSAGFLRACLITLAGAMFIQFLPMELALFAAADLLAWAEVAAAMALIAAQVRVRAFVQTLVRRARAVVASPIRRAGRAVRAVRRRAPRPHRSDDPDGWAFA